MKKKYIIALLFFCLVGSGTFIFWKFQDDYHHWRIERFISEADESLSSGNQYALELVVSNLLKQYPERLETLRFMARLADARGKGDAVYWRRRIVDTYPKLEDERLALGLTYIRLKQMPMALYVIKTWPQPKNDSLAHLQLKAAYAFALNNDSEAYKLFETIYQQAPTLSHKLNWAKAALRLPELDKQADGEASLLAILEQSPETDADRILIRHYIQQSRLEEARALTRDAWKSPSLSWNKRFALLEAASILQLAELSNWRSETEAIIKEDKQQASRYGSWLLAFVDAEASAQWFEAIFEEAERQAYPTALPYAEALMKLKQSDTLIRLFKNADWGMHDSLRLTILARASIHASNEPSWWKSLWERALNHAEENEGGLEFIAYFLQTWGWEDFESEALKKMRERSPQNMAIYSRLNYLLEKAKDEQGLWENAKKEWQAFPTNLLAKNNYSYLSLLLKRDIQKAQKLAEENFREAENNPYFKATYAFSLLETSPERALYLLESINNLDQITGLAMTWAWVLGENNQTEEAARIAAAIEDKYLLPSQLEYKRMLLGTENR